MVFELSRGGKRFFGPVNRAKMLPEEMTEEYIDLLYMASRRILLDFSGVDKVLLSNKIYSLPVQESSIRKYFEYALTLKVKLKRKEYADFIRAITPILFDLYEKILARHANIELKDYCIQRENKSWLWSKDKLCDTSVLDVLELHTKNFHYGDVSSYHMSELIQNSNASLEVRDLVKNLRSVESNLRNMAAHQIISVTEETIQKQTGFSSSQIMDQIQKAFVYAGINIKKEYWNSYDDMNEIIKTKITKW